MSLGQAPLAQRLQCHPTPFTYFTASAGAEPFWYRAQAGELPAELIVDRNLCTIAFSPFAA
jgi:hypothetical protein